MCKIFRLVSYILNVSIMVYFYVKSKICKKKKKKKIFVFPKMFHVDKYILKTCTVVCVCVCVCVWITYAVDLDLVSGVMKSVHTTVQQISGFPHRHWFITVTDLQMSGLSCSSLVGPLVVHLLFSSFIHLCYELPGVTWKQDRTTGPRDLDSTQDQ